MNIQIEILIQQRQIPFISSPSMSETSIEDIDLGGSVIVDSDCGPMSSPPLTDNISRLHCCNRGILSDASISQPSDANRGRQANCHCLGETLLKVRVSPLVEIYIVVNTPHNNNELNSINLLTEDTRKISLLHFDSSARIYASWHRNHRQLSGMINRISNIEGTINKASLH